MRRARGFTLMELMVAMSIGLVVVAGATTAIVSITRSTVQTRQQSKADIEAKLLVDWIGAQMQQVGGGSVRPQMALEIEDDCATTTFTLEGSGTMTLPDCDGSDRLNFLLIDGDAPQCEITSFAGTTAQMDAAEACCTGTAFLQDVSVIIVDSSGNWETRLCTNHNTSSCHCVFPAGQSAYNPPGGAFTATDEPYLVQGSSATIYLDPADHILKMMVDTDHDGTMEVKELAPHVYDFQATLLWDTDNNGTPETESVDVPSGGNASMLRMIRIGLVVGVPVPSRTTPTGGQVLNGPARSASSGLLMRSVVATTGLRNLYVFY